jgi:hypothetical protein
MTFTRARHSQLFTFASIVALLASASLAQAGPLATTNFALNDTFGPDAGRWHGSVSVAAVDAFTGDALAAEVDWAAFGPGKFQLYLNSQGIAQSDPSAPGEVIYVYEITTVSAAAPGIDALTVGVDATDGRGTVSAPSMIPKGVALEQSPTSGGDQGTSMAWFFEGTELQVGENSSLLVFTSPFAPEFDFLLVNSGLAAQFPSPLVASPSDRLFTFDIPEPTSLAMGLMSCFGLLLRSRMTR